MNLQITAKKLFFKLKNNLKTEYFKNIIGQAGIVLIAQLIPVIFSPLISRFYNENALAEITGLVSLSSIFLVFSSLKLGQTIILEKEEKKAKQLMLLIFLIAFSFAIFFTVILVIFKDFFTNSFKIDNVIFAIPIYILAFSILRTYDFWFIRMKKFKYKAYAKIVETSLYLILSFGLYYLLGENEYGLALGKIFGVIFALFFFSLLQQF